jgi:hypothetical protein
MKEENFLVNNADFGVPDKRSTTLDDINMGWSYYKAYKIYIKHPMSEMLFPLIFFIDKTYTDVNGRVCLEPIQFTLGIFKRSSRNQARAWRSLGYIYNQNKVTTMLSADKMLDYHVMLGEVLKPLKEAQQQGSIAWNMELKWKAHEVQLRIPVMFIIGNTDGHDKLVGKHGNCTKCK